MSFTMLWIICAIVTIVGIFVIRWLLVDVQPKLVEKENKKKEEERKQIIKDAIPDYVREEIEKINNDLSKKKSIQSILKERRAVAVLEGIHSDESGAKSGSYIVIFRTQNRILSYSSKEDHIYINTPIYYAEKVTGSYTHYNPSKYVYTGVTVGGVTTGGITDVGNYYSEEAIHSDKYAMAYGPGNKFFFMVQKIHLDDELYNRAKNSPEVKAFLDTNRKYISVCRNSKTTHQADIGFVASTGNMEAFEVTQWQNFLEQLLPFNQCYGILTWFGDNLKSISSK